MLEQFDCLAASTDIWGSHFIEASAGTGKTFTIEHVVARALLDDASIEIENILIVTFTRAATRDLKLRIRKRLRLCISDLEQRNSEHGYLKELIACGDTAIAEATNRIKKALCVFDKAQIFTIHSFCHKMLTAAGFDANVTFGQVDPDENNYEAFAQGQVHDYLRVGLDAKQFSPSQIERALKFSGSKIDLLTKKLLHLSNKVDPQKAYLSIADTVCVLNSELKKINAPALHVVTEELCAMAKNFKGLSHRSGTFLEEVNEQIDFWSKVICDRFISNEQLGKLVRYDPNFLLSLTDDNRKKRAAEFAEPGWFKKSTKKTLRHIFKSYVIQGKF